MNGREYEKLNNSIPVVVSGGKWWINDKSKGRALVRLMKASCKSSHETRCLLAEFVRNAHYPRSRVFGVTDLTDPANTTDYVVYVAEEDIHGRLHLRLRNQGFKSISESSRVTHVLRDLCTRRK